MIRIALVLVTLLLVAPVAPSRAAERTETPPASAVPAGELVAAQQALHAAVTRGSAQDILKVRAQFAALSAAHPQSAALHYWVAVSDWRVSPRLDDKASLERYCLDGIKEADAALKLEPKNAEALAIKSSLLGLSLGFRPSAMFTVGPEIESAIQAAQAIAPDNPRVLLLAGINTLNKPGFVGGGAGKALPILIKAQERFATAPASADSTAPAWGRDDAYLWAGRAEMKRDEFAKARDYYAQALEVNPDNAWVKNRLLPEAEKSLAGASASK